MSEDKQPLMQGQQPGPSAPPPAYQREFSVKNLLSYKLSCGLGVSSQTVEPPL